jgi:predicted transglutaminase-like cysteine proteinase
MLVRKSEITARAALSVACGLLFTITGSSPVQPATSDFYSTIDKKSARLAAFVVPALVETRQEPAAGPKPETAALVQKPLAEPAAAGVQPVVAAIEPQLTKPAPAAPAAAHPNDGSVFSSIAFQIGGIPGKARWASLRTAGLDTAACGTACPAGSVIGKAIEAVRDKPVAEKLVAINSAVNRAIAYTRDKDIYGKRDYWAKPQETLERAKGDCEDFAILKMAALKAAGVPTSDMTLVVLRDTRRNLFHAVLAVATVRGQFILDNLRGDVPRDTSIGNYQALYSMNENRTFIHGYKTGSRLTAGAQSIGAAQPGEG